MNRSLFALSFLLLFPPLAHGNLLFGQGLHLIRVPNFLSEDEIQHFLSLADRVAAQRQGKAASSSSSSSSASASSLFTRGDRYGRSGLYLGSPSMTMDDFTARGRAMGLNASQLEELESRWVFDDDEPLATELRTDAIITAVEERIAEHAMMPAKVVGEAPMMVGRWISPPSPGLLKDVHHDLNNSPRRAVTALVYLTDADSAGFEGGETVFPCLGDDIDRDLCRTLVRGFRQGKRFLNPPGHPRNAWNHTVFQRVAEIS